jgi:hypothetical protein
MKSKKKLTGMDWLRAQMERNNYGSLEVTASQMSINRGNLYRYFTFENRPSVDMLPVMATALDTTIDDLLVALEVL